LRVEWDRGQVRWNERKIDLLYERMI